VIQAQRIGRLDSHIKPRFDPGMPWTIPNLLLHDKPASLSNMRSHGRNHVFVYCSNPDCYHNTELDVSRFPDDMTFNDLQPRMLCTVCDHRGADVGPSWRCG
jgi:hypothetical protein